jgi:glycosyltransferase involved in cell wall biosynthesis
VPQRPLRVAALIPGDGFTGPSGQVASTAVHLEQRGVEVLFVLLVRPGANSGELPEYLRQHGLSFETVRDRGPLDIAILRRVWRVLEAFRPSLLESHGYKATAVAFALRARRPSWRWIGYFHGLTFESRRARSYHLLDRWMLGFADRVVAITREQRRNFLGRLPTVDVVASAVPSLSPGGSLSSEIRATIRSLPRPIIGLVGRLSPEKGADILLHALHILHGRGARHSVAIAGDGPQRGDLTQLVLTLELERHVLFLGRLEDVASLYAEIDLLVIPSRSEGLPSVLLEALAADLPVVATDVGAIREVLVESDCGIVVPPERPRELADAIEHSLPCLRNARASAARRSAVARFSQDTRTEQLLAIYRELASPVGSQ